MILSKQSLQASSVGNGVVCEAACSGGYYQMQGTKPYNGTSSGNGSRNARV
jgi:hypothetical protein